MQRFRIEYSKSGALRYTGNLDMQKVWERFVRRASLPVVYSQGFHPQPKIQQACPLPLGFYSTAEIVDIWLEDDQITPEEVRDTLVATGQPGLIISLVRVVSLSDPALQSMVKSAHYTAELHSHDSPQQIPAQIQRMIEASTLIRQRRNKPYDLRPLIEELLLRPENDQDQPVLEMRLAAREGATGRPDEVLRELGLDPSRAVITRTRLFFE